MNYQDLINAYGGDGVISRSELNNYTGSNWEKLLNQAAKGKFRLGSNAQTYANDQLAAAFFTDAPTTGPVAPNQALIDNNLDVEEQFKQEPITSPTAPIKQTPIKQTPINEPPSSSSPSSSEKEKPEMGTIPGLSGVKFNPETGLFEVGERSEGLYGGRNITLQNTGANITRRAGAETGGIDYGKIGSDAAAASIAAQVGEDGTTPAEYFAGLQEQIDSYVPGTFGAEYLDQVQAERKAATSVKDKEEEPYKSEVKSLKIPKKVLQEISTGYTGLKESDYKDKEISFDGKSFDDYMKTDGDKKEIQPMVDAGMGKADMKRWGKALGISNVNKTSEAEDIVKAYQKGYLPGKKPKTSYELSNTVQDRFGNVFTVSEYNELKDSGTKDKEVEKFLKDFIKGGGRVGSGFSVRVPEITIPEFF